MQTIHSSNRNMAEAIILKYVYKVGIYSICMGKMSVCKQDRLRILIQIFLISEKTILTDLY
jgi:hypothetical protein